MAVAAATRLIGILIPLKLLFAIHFHCGINFISWPDFLSLKDADLFGADTSQVTTSGLLVETGQSEPLDIFASVLGTYEWNPFRDPLERHVRLQALHHLKRSSGRFDLAG